MNEEQLEQNIQDKGLTAPRLTPDDIKNTVRDTDYIVKGTLTICILTLNNGFTVSGTSSCISPENFDKQIGQDVAHSNAMAEIWKLEGYLLKEKIFQHDPESEQKLRVYLIAEVAHEVNREYCEGIGDMSQPTWFDAPDWQKESAYDGVRFHLANPGVTPEQSHENWLKVKIADGWVYGDTKNADLKKHPCCVPYVELPIEQQVKDNLFGAVVESLRNMAV